MLTPLYAQFLGDLARRWVTGHSLYQPKKSHRHSFNTCLLNFCIVLAVWNLLVNKTETSSCPSDFNLNTFFYYSWVLQEMHNIIYCLTNLARLTLKHPFGLSEEYLEPCLWRKSYEMLISVSLNLYFFLGQHLYFRHSILVLFLSTCKS